MRTNNIASSVSRRDLCFLTTFMNCVQHQPKSQYKTNMMSTYEMNDYPKSPLRLQAYCVVDVIYQPATMALEQAFKQKTRGATYPLLIKTNYLGNSHSQSSDEYKRPELTPSKFYCQACDHQVSRCTTSNTNQEDSYTDNDDDIEIMFDGTVFPKLPHPSISLRSFASNDCKSISIIPFIPHLIPDHEGAISTFSTQQVFCCNHNHDTIQPILANVVPLGNDDDDASFNRTPQQFYYEYTYQKRDSKEYPDIHIDTDIAQNSRGMVRSMRSTNLFSMHVPFADTAW